MNKREHSEHLQGDHLLCAAFHRGLHCLLRQNRSLDIQKYNILESIIYEPYVFTMHHPDLSICRFLFSIGLKRVHKNGNIYFDAIVALRMGNQLAIIKIIKI